MVDGQGDAWSRRVFGDEDGPKLRALVPTMVEQVHTRMVNAQGETGGTHEGVYGQIWREVFDEFTGSISEHFPHASVFRPKAAGKDARAANYKLASLAGVPIYPWRYAHSLKVGPDQAKFVSGTKPSATRIDLLGGRIKGNHPTLFEIAARSAQDDRAARARDQAVRADVEKLLREDAHPCAVLVRFASSPFGLVRIMWGDAVLRPDGTLHSNFSEDLDFLKGGSGHNRQKHKRAVNDDQQGRESGRRGFADGPLNNPRLRPKPPE